MVDSDKNQDCIGDKIEKTALWHGQTAPTFVYFNLFCNLFIGNLFDRF